MIRSSAMVVAFISLIVAGGDVYGKESAGFISSQLDAYSLSSEEVLSIKAEKIKTEKTQPKSKPKPSSSKTQEKKTTVIKQQKGKKVFVSNDFKRWYVPRGVSLFNVLQHWTDAAGWSLIWNVEYQFDLMATASFSGNFMDAMRMLMDSLGGVQPILYIRVYPENKVVVVSLDPNI